MALPEPVRTETVNSFKEDQATYSGKITNAFSDSLRTLFITSAVTMGLAAVLVFTLKERELAQSSPDATPGEA